MQNIFKRFLFSCFSVCMLLFVPVLHHAQILPPNFSQVQYPGITDPTAMVALPDGRILITEQGGKILVFKNGTILPNPAMSISLDHSGERGFLGITIDPDFSSNGFIYICYTVLANPAYNVVSSFTMAGDVVVPGSETILLRLDDLSTQTIHNGGALCFSTDGKLYISVGDNAYGMNYLNTGAGLNPQDITNYFGKLLRINKDGSIPTDNPYYANASSVAKRIWATGLRNPYTLAVHPTNGKIFINDVGQESWEEINDGTPGGKNFGWPFAEGNSNNVTFSNPLFIYQNIGYQNNNNQDAVGCAITGGVFYNPSAGNYPSDYNGKYFYLDHCNSWINYIDYSSSPVQRYSFATGLDDGIVYMCTGSDGNLYYLSRGSNALFKILYSGNTSPVITKQPENNTVSAGQRATFSIAATGAAPITYQWLKNGSSITGANSFTYVLNNVQPSDAAIYRCKITNLLGSATSTGATLTVTPFNNKPSGTIVSPLSSFTYRYGDVISFSGTASDTEDGSIATSGMTWAIRFAHNHNHYHPVNTFDNVSNGSFVADFPETDADVSYQILLISRDSQGLRDTAITEILPQKIQYQVPTSPAGLQLAFDGRASANIDKSLVYNSVHSIQAISPQVEGGNAYEFERWSKDGASFKVINAIPSQKDTAFYRPAAMVAGLQYAYAQGTWSNVPDFNAIPIIKTGLVSSFDISPAAISDNFAFQFTGFIDINTDGLYTFYTNSDDGSLLYIDGSLVVDNNGLHGSQEKSGTIQLSPGKHTIKVEFFEASGGELLTVKYSGPGIAKQDIPSSKLFRIETPIFTVPGIVQPPVIDALEDVLWIGITPYPINTIPTGTITIQSDLQGSFRLTYDANNLYLYIEVKDNMLMNESANAYDDDAIEIFIDADNSKLKNYDGVNDLQYLFGWNDPTFAELKLNKTAGISFAQRNTPSGYVMEILFPRTTLGIGASGIPLIGFDIQIDDDDSGGGRDKSRAWRARTNDAWKDPSIFGKVELSGLVTVPAVNCNATGTLLQETWSNIGGTSLQALNTDLPPTTSGFLSSFETPTNAADNYGTRIRGYLCVPTSGNYTFWVAGDDNVQLLLSPDEDPVKKAVIAFHNGWTNSREWSRYETQQSAAIPLQGGKKYYVEALVKEGSGGDNLAVGWQLPDGTLERPIMSNRISPFIISTVISPNMGDGLAVIYYDNMDFTGTSISRIDNTVNFYWEGGSPDPAIGPDQFSARWTGQVKAPVSELYTFYTNSDDGIRLWINDQLIIDNWTNHAPTENSGTILLTGGQKYNIKLEYFENGGGATATLSWSSASLPKQIIPKSYLYSNGPGVKIGNSQSDIAMTIYPVPASEQVNVVLHQQEKISRWSLLNEYGQEMLTQQPDTQALTSSFEINTKQLNAGMYILMVVSNDKTLKMKIPIVK